MDFSESYAFMRQAVLRGRLMLFLEGFFWHTVVVFPGASEI
jgi:hypothetical protein